MPVAWSFLAQARKRSPKRKAVVLIMRNYTVILKHEPVNNGYSVWVPALPGCASQGETKEEAMSNIKEAMELYLDGLKEDGLPLPTDVETLVIGASA